MKKKLINLIIAGAVLSTGIGKTNLMKIEKTTNKPVQIAPLVNQPTPKEQKISYNEYIKTEKNVYKSLQDKFNENPKKFIKENELYINSWKKAYGNFPIPLPYAILKKTIETFETFPLKFPISYTKNIKKPEDILDYKSILYPIGEDLISPLMDIIADTKTLKTMEKDKLRNPWKFNEIDATYYGERGFHIYPYF